MAQRPWVTPDDVREYTDIADVQNRSDAKLKIDISRAEQTIISRTKNRFEEYDQVPDEIKTAVILVAEYYAEKAKKGSKDFKSESFDDYNYTIADGSSGLAWPDIDPMLEDYIVKESRNAVEMKLRKL